MPQQGWYEDPEDPTQLRWWTGSDWTADRRPRTVTPPPPTNRPYIDPGPPTAPRTPSTAAPWTVATGPVSPVPSGWNRPAAGNGAAPARTFPEAVRVCFEKFGVFQGRASRSEFWYWHLFLLLALLGLTFLVGMLAAFAGASDRAIEDLGAVVTALLVLAAIVPSIAVGVRRLHDVGLSGWLYLVSLIPWLGSIALFVLSVLPGQPDTNRYG